MKKVLLGVGIGCGALSLIGVVLVIAGGFWAKGKIEESVGDLEQYGKRQEAAQERVQSLDERFAFTAPEDGHPVRLEEGRVADYLAIRAAMLPVFKDYEQKGKDLEASAKAKGAAGISEGFKAMGIFADLIAELQEKWAAQLEARRMSPSEYRAITEALYTSEAGKAMGEIRRGQRAMLMQAKAQIARSAEAKDLPDEARAELAKSEAELDVQLAALPPEDAQPSELEKLHVHNAAIAAKHKGQIEEYGNLVLDGLLLGDGAYQYGNVRISDDDQQWNESDEAQADGEEEAAE